MSVTTIHIKGKKGSVPCAVSRIGDKATVEIGDARAEGPSDSIVITEDSTFDEEALIIRTGDLEIWLNLVPPTTPPAPGENLVPYIKMMPNYIDLGPYSANTIISSEKIERIDFSCDGSTWTMAGREAEKVGDNWKITFNNASRFIWVKIPMRPNVVLFVGVQ